MGICKYGDAQVRVCFKTHSHNLHPSFRGIFARDFVNIARYNSSIR